MSLRSATARLFLAATLAGAAAPALAHAEPTAVAQALPSDAPGHSDSTKVKVDVPDTVDVSVDHGKRNSYLVIGLSTAAVIGVLLLIVLLARGGERVTEIHHHHS